MTRRRQLAPWEIELVHRRAAPDRIAAAARRGRALCNAALAGQPIDVPAATPATEVRQELTACAKCYRPHEAPPQSTCTRCQTTPKE